MRTVRSVVVAAACVCSLLATPTLAQETMLQNDEFTDGDPVGFQGGFVVGEMAAVRLVPTGTGPWRVNRVHFLFGGSTATRTITLRIYDDTAGTAAPGAQLFFGDYELTGSATAMHEVLLIPEDVQVPGQFRVAIEFQHSGAPSVARDTDGTIDAPRNFIFTPSIPGWFQSNLFGVAGDWIIRAGVEPVTGGGGGSEPEILSILDVGNDQGKQVRVRFLRSDQDAPGATTPVLGYEIFRRIDQLLAATKRLPPPGVAMLDGWDYVASLPAHGENTYSMVVPTLADSTLADGMHWSVFLVRAATASPLTFFDSPPDSGYSLDNLSPAPPTGLAYGGGEISWTPAPETDFDYYTVYGSNSPGFGPGAAMLDHTSANAFLVSSAPAYRYYFVTATDFAGNEGNPATIDLGPTTDARAPRVALELRAAPNPFNPTTVLHFDLANSEHVKLEIYRPDGRWVSTLRDHTLGAGSHRVTWDGRDAHGATVASGGYIARLQAAGVTRNLSLRLVR